MGCGTLAPTGPAFSCALHAKRLIRTVDSKFTSSGMRLSTKSSSYSAHSVRDQASVASRRLFTSATRLAPRIYCHKP